MNGKMAGKSYTEDRQEQCCAIARSRDRRYLSSSHHFISYPPVLWSFSSICKPLRDIFGHINKSTSILEYTHVLAIFITIP